MSTKRPAERARRRVMGQPQQLDPVRVVTWWIAIPLSSALAGYGYWLMYSWAVSR